MMLKSPAMYMPFFFLHMHGSMRGESLPLSTWGSALGLGHVYSSLEAGRGAACMSSGTWELGLEPVQRGRVGIVGGSGEGGNDITFQTL
jgi:hypothetical protein